MGKIGNLISHVINLFWDNSIALGVLIVMSAKSRNYQWLNVILLSLVITGFSGCDNNAQELDPNTATARLKALPDFFYYKSMNADKITQIRSLIKS